MNVLYQLGSACLRKASFCSSSFMFASRIRVLTQVTIALSDSLGDPLYAHNLARAFAAVLVSPQVLVNFVLKSVQLGHVPPVLV